jgi:AcrR family transcriptional regulator
VKAARELFGHLGYDACSIQHIVDRAGVTRGALYHYFDSKETLFRETFEEVHRENLRNHDTRVGDSWERFLLGTVDFLSMCRDPSRRQIMLIDAPSVLGWS